MSELLEALRTAQPLPTASHALEHYSAMADEAQRMAKRPQNPARWASWLRELPEGALRIAAAGLAADLALIKGHGLTAQEGCFTVEAFLGDADVLVEFDHQPSEGDGWNEPHYDESVTPICALVNGVWVDADQFSETVLDRWHQAGIERLEFLRECDEADRAEARHHTMQESF